MTGKMNRLRARKSSRFSSKLAMLAAMAWVVGGGCSSRAQVFNSAFQELFTGSQVPAAPGPDAGYVMAMVYNSGTDKSVEFVVSAETEEIILSLDNSGQLSGAPITSLTTQTASLVTDVNSPTLGIPFDYTPVDFPPVGVNQLTTEDYQNILSQLVAKDPESIGGRKSIRLVRVLRIGLGPDLNAPSGQDDGIIVRETGSNPAETSGNILPSGVNPALSFQVREDSPDFGNGDLIIFLATKDSRTAGGVSVAAGVLDGDAANANNAQFTRDTFKILRDVEGPISPSTED